MPLTRLDNLYSSKTGKYLYVSPDDFNATDELENRGNSPLRPFKTIQRAFIEVARYSYLPGKDNDRFDQFSIMLMPGNHYIDNRPGLVASSNPEQRYLDAANLIELNRQEIVDRSAAEIAIQYPNFVYPGSTGVENSIRFKDSYRLIQLNRSEIVTTAYNYIATVYPGFVNPNPALCQRDIGYFVDAVSLDIAQADGNVYSRKFIQNYFNQAGNAWIANGLQGEQNQSITAFEKARDEMKKAIANLLTVKDLTITADPVTGSNTSALSCANVRSAIDVLSLLVTDAITAGNLTGLPAESISEEVPAGEEKCKRDLRFVVDAIVADIRTGGNSNIISATKSYFDREGNPVNNAITGEVVQSITAFNYATTMMNKAVTNQLYSKDFTISVGPAYAGAQTPIVPHLPSGNPAVCVDVQNNITTLMEILVDTLDAGNLQNLVAVQITGQLPVFNFNRALEEWQDNSIIDLSNPDNVLYKFNAASGGCIVPRGCSLIGYDLRRTIIRPLYVPDPADGNQERTSIFNLTGGCYIWQFTIKDGDLSENSPLYDPVDRVGKVYAFKGNNTNLAVPEYSHHKITIMVYADNDDLDTYYEKVSRAFAQFQPTIDDGDFQTLVQENRIVGPLSDTRTIESILVQNVDGGNNTLATVTTKIDHGYFVGQYIAVLNTGLSEELNGTFKVESIDQNNPKIFSYKILKNTAGLGLVNGQLYTIANGLGTNAIGQAEIDSVESASPYVFNCSIRSTWGICGMWADGSRATGFKSMVVAQYTGVSLQRDDRAFIRYDKFTNTWNQASLTDAFATVPYHTKGDAYWKDDWRNFHIRASDDSFIQCVSVFAVGFHDHFLMESGGDMSITNSNSNFGNTSLHAKGFKGFSFNQDKGGYITDIIPPQVLSDARSSAIKNQYYTLDIRASNDVDNHTKLYIGSEDATNPDDRPAASINKYRLGAKTDDRIYVKLDPSTTGGSEEFYSTLTPTGFKTYTAALETLNPSGISIDNKAQDAANRVGDNKLFIQQEAYGYITAKYPALLSNQNITISKCQRDIGLFVDAVVQDLRLGGNINTIQAAEGYFIGGQLSYIQNELSESLQTYDYVKNLCISAIRNFNFLIRNCQTTANSALVTVGSTTGLHVGMSVREYSPSFFVNNEIVAGGATPLTNNIQSNTIIKRIVNSTTIELGTLGSVLNNGTVRPALLNSTTAYLYFEAGVVWAITPRNVDTTITQDTSYPECANIASTIAGYFENVSLILNGNGNTVIRVEPTFDSSLLSGRATLFTINTGGGTSNPHNFETGTAVRLVPIANPNAFGEVDKRLIRLPKGFDTNTKYYVITPGRNTYPEDYSGTTYFNGSDQTKLMLAATKENAAAGIYINSPETDAIDPNVQILFQQYTLDSKYDLHKYKSNLAGAGEIETEIPHIFDLPSAGITPQKVFFRIADGIVGSDLPEIAGQGTINTQKYYYARYITPTKFSVHNTHPDAIAGVNSINFVTESGKDFYVFADKRTSPLKYDAEFKDISSGNSTGLWYLQVKDESTGGVRQDSILTRLHANDYDDASGKIRTTDTWFERIDDFRAKEDRIYRLRYVIPSYLETVRDPLNGFIIKVRTDDKRRLLPQKICLKPVGSAPNVARFDNPNQANEILGLTDSQLLVQQGLTPKYDPYLFPKVIGSDKTQSKIAFTIQSAQKIVQDGSPNEYLEIVAFDHTITNQALKNEIFSVVQISPAQGGNFVTNASASNASNAVKWTGNSTGTGYIQGYFASNSNYYMILKNVSGEIKYDSNTQTIFTQGNVFSYLTAKPNSIGDPLGRDKSDRREFLYRISGANVYTLVPGDIITDDASNQYYVDSVQDVGQIEDTFYIFNINTIQQRIPGQQDGVYYLTAVRGNISPYPTGAGVGENFRNYKFSQPISQLYPLSYKNDPLWFQVRPDGTRDSSIVDPPQSVAAADNYVHGYVTLNDSKNSETKEAIKDLLKTPALSSYAYTATSLDVEGELIDNVIKAQEGNASAGSENRIIKISGDSPYTTKRKLYVELRRPSIARSGNHTFEYLGFGPGNYSTGFPLRQEVVLSDRQDQYAQSKREDGGTVFYTGLNSNGDLYIGNRKINAITGEETYLERAVLEESEDDVDNIGALVTTFDTAVTFNDKITVEGDSFFNNPVEINVDPLDGNSLRIYSKVLATDDPTLDRSSFRDPRNGDIVLTKNKISSAVFALNPRGNVGQSGQTYTIRTHYAGGSPSNVVPDQRSTKFYPIQNVSYGNVQVPQAGDWIFKGVEVGKSGSLGWMYSNYYNLIQDSEIFNLTADGTSTIIIQWAAGLTNASLGVTAGEYLRISNFSNGLFNGTWVVVAAGFSASASTCKIQIQNAIANNTYAWSSESPGAAIEISKSTWKEVGVIGAESFRTNTEVQGDYRVGINTIGRAAHDAVLTANVSLDTDPRANLDLVGTMFVSGKTLVSYNQNGNVIQNNYTSTPSNGKSYFLQTNAVLIGGNSATPNDYATLRISTSDVAQQNRTSSYRVGGRFGINTSIGLDPSTELNRNFVVVGDARITGNLKIEDDISVDGGDINTTATTFNLLNQTADIVNSFGDAEIINVGNNTTGSQNINIGNASTTQSIQIGGTAVNTILNIHKNSTNAVVDIASTTDAASSYANIIIGGAFNNANSQTTIGTFQTKIAGQLEIGTKYAAGSFGPSKLFTQTRGVELFCGDQTSTVDFALNASNLTIGSVGGRSIIRNSLSVLASITGNANIKLSGGLNAGIIEIERARLGTTSGSHIVGGLDNPNIDFYKYQITGRTIDTSGVQFWGGTNFLVAGGQIAGIDTFVGAGANVPRQRGIFNFIFPTGGNGTGASFNITVLVDGSVSIELASPGTGYLDNDVLIIADAQLGGGGGPEVTFQVNGVNASGSNYYLPISTPSISDFGIGDLILIERGNSNSPDVAGTAPNQVTGLRNEARSEIVRVSGLINLTNPNDPSGYRLQVTRAQDGTAARTDHPDNCVIAKLIKQTNASYITGKDVDLNGEIDVPASGITAGSANVRIGVSEFGGILTTSDYLRLSDTEIVKVVNLVTTDIQSLIVTDGGFPESTVFKVESTTGNTYGNGSLNFGAGFNKFVVQGSNGNTSIAGTLTTENTLKINGSTILNTQFFTITNGGSDTVPLRTTFEIDTSTGDVRMNGGNINIFGTNGTTPRLTFNNSSGDLTTYGSLSALGTGVSTFGGDLVIGGDATINGGDLTVNSANVTKFKVSNNGSMTIAGIANYFSQTGGRKWLYADNFVIEAQANVNYFVNTIQNTLFKLPRNALIGDMIRIIDIGGNLTYNLSLVIRAEDNIQIQDVVDNTGFAMLSGVSQSNFTGYNGGELVVQTPYAAFALVYAGASYPDGNQAVPSAKVGWYLVEV